MMIIFLFIRNIDLFLNLSLIKLFLCMTPMIIASQLYFLNKENILFAPG